MICSINPINTPHRRVLFPRISVDRGSQRRGAGGWGPDRVWQGPTTVHAAEQSAGPGKCKPGNIVVAVDTTQDSLSALHWAISHLYREGESSLVILHVVPDVYDSPAPGSIYYEETADPELEAALEAEARAFLEEQFVSRAAAAGIPARVVLVREGNTRHVGWAVAKAAEELQACPLVLAKHNQSAWEAMFLGSVATFCAAHCKQPVLLIPPITQK
ncbi:hypothetical protein ACKKBG_A25905 [Auxenochlorella protothecoides x Auxenochlorella symbiontica]